MFRSAETARLKEDSWLKEVGNDFDFEFKAGKEFIVLFHEADFGQYAVLDFFNVNAPERVCYWVDDEALEPINEGEGE